MTAETLLAEKWIFQTLNASSSLNSLVLGGYNADIAPSDATYPMVIFTNQSAEDERTFNNKTKVFTDTLYLVEVVGKTTSYTTLSPIFDLMDSLLDVKSGLITGGGYVLSCVRERIQKRREFTNGVEYKRLGAVYRIEVRN
jgi:hypothetical protein